MLPQNFFKSSGIYAFSNICNKSVGFLMLPLYTRYLTPEDYGVVALLIFTQAIFQTLLGVRLGLALPKFYHQEISENRNPDLFISTAFVLTSTISLFVSIALFYYKEPISTVIFGENTYALLAGLFFTTLLSQSIEVYGMVYLRILNNAKLYLYISLFKLALQLFLNIYLIVVLELGALGIVLSTVISSFVLGVIFAVYLINKTGFCFKPAAAKSMVLYAAPLWLSALSGLYIWTSSRYFTRLYSNLDDVGLIELAAKFASILIAIFWEPFMLYWSAERFNIYYKNKDKKIYQRVYEIITVVLLIGVIGIALLSDSVIRIMADPSFHPSSILIAPLLLGSMFYALGEFNNLGFMIKNKTNMIAVNDFFVAGILTALYIFLIPAIGVLGAAIAMLAAQFLQYVLYVITVKKYFDMELKGFFFFSMLAFTIILICISKLLTLENNLHNIMIQLLLTIVGCTTILICYFVRNKHDFTALYNKLSK